MVRIVFFRDIALVVDVMVNSTSLGRVGTRKVLEVKAFLLQLLTACQALAIGVQLLKDVAVARLDAVDAPNHIDLLVGLLVVIAVAARVAAELLVHAPDDGFAAIEAFSFFHLFISCSVIQLFSYSVV